MKVTASPTFTWAPETFLAKMTRDGRLTIPKMAVQVFKELMRNEEENEDLALEVQLDPLKKAE